MCDIEYKKQEMENSGVSYWEASEIHSFHDDYCKGDKWKMGTWHEESPFGDVIFSKSAIGTSIDSWDVKRDYGYIKNILKGHTKVIVTLAVTGAIVCPSCGKKKKDWNISYCKGIGYASQVLITIRNKNVERCVISKKYILGGGEFYEVSLNICEKQYSKKPCSNCRNKVEFYDEEGKYKEGGVDSLFDCMVWAHGFSTGFSGRCDTEEIIDRLVNLYSHHEWQICCSHKSQRIGSIGAYVMGHAQYVSNIDLYSYIDERGYRVFDLDDWRSDGLINSPEEISLDSWDHNEVIVAQHRIVGIWIKEWALKDPNLKKLWDYLVPIAKDNGWVVHVCKARRE